MKTKFSKSVNPKALAALKFIKAYYKRHKYPPCIREIAEALGGLSTSVVTFYLQDLKARRLIKMTPGVSRSYVPIEVFSDPCEGCTYKEYAESSKELIYHVVA
jgi:SOS-response transcriptional repressor LexA